MSGSGDGGRLSWIDDLFLWILILVFLGIQVGALPPLPWWTEETVEIEEPLPPLQAVPCQLFDGGAGREGRSIWIASCAEGVEPRIMTFSMDVEYGY